MDGVCSTLRGGVHTEFWWETLTEEDHLQNVGVNGMLILKLFLEKEFEGVDYSLGSV
jgi:hypothetical protein